MQKAAPRPRARDYLASRTDDRAVKAAKLRGNFVEDPSAWRIADRGSAATSERVRDTYEALSQGDSHHFSRGHPVADAGRGRRGRADAHRRRRDGPLRDHARVPRQRGAREPGDPRGSRASRLRPLQVQPGEARDGGRPRLQDGRRGHRVRHQPDDRVPADQPERRRGLRRGQRPAPEDPRGDEEAPRRGRRDRPRSPRAASSTCRKAPRRSTSSTTRPSSRSAARAASSSRAGRSRRPRPVALVAAGLFASPRDAALAWWAGGPGALSSVVPTLSLRRRTADDRKLHCARPARSARRALDAVRLRRAAAERPHHRPARLLPLRPRPRREPVRAGHGLGRDHRLRPGEGERDLRRQGHRPRRVPARQRQLSGDARPARLPSRAARRHREGALARRRRGALEHLGRRGHRPGLALCAQLARGDRDLRARAGRAERRAPLGQGRARGARALPRLPRR